MKFKLKVKLTYLFIFLPPSRKRNIFVLESRPTSELNFWANLCRVHSSSCEERQLETIQFAKIWQVFSKKWFEGECFHSGCWGHEWSNFWDSKFGCSTENSSVVGTVLQARRKTVSKMLPPPQAHMLQIWRTFLVHEFLTNGNRAWR